MEKMQPDHVIAELRAVREGRLVRASRSRPKAPGSDDPRDAGEVWAHVHKAPLPGASLRATSPRNPLIKWFSGREGILPSLASQAR